MKRIIAPALALAMALTLAVPGIAAAAPVREYQLQFSPVGDTGSSQMIVTAILDPETPLPAEVVIPVPTGATVLWAGEILGGDPADDLRREVAAGAIGSTTIYTMTLEQAYVGQVELGLAPPKVAGRTVSSSVEWTNPGDEVLVGGSVISEAGATDVEIEPAPVGAPQTNALGESLYPLGGLRLAAGGTYAIDVSWKRGGGESGFPVVPVVGVALVLAILALVLLLVREQNRRRNDQRAEPE